MKCKGTTKKGNRCTNTAVLNGYCIVHFSMNQKKNNKKRYGKVPFIDWDKIK